MAIFGLTGFAAYNQIIGPSGVSYYWTNINQPIWIKPLSRQFIVKTNSPGYSNLTLTRYSTKEPFMHSVGENTLMVAKETSGNMVKYITSPTPGGVLVGGGTVPVYDFSLCGIMMGGFLFEKDRLRMTAKVDTANHYAVNVTTTSTNTDSPTGLNTWYFNSNTNRLIYNVEISSSSTGLNFPSLSKQYRVRFAMRVNHPVSNDFHLVVRYYNKGNTEDMTWYKAVTSPSNSDGYSMNTDMWTGQTKVVEFWCDSGKKLQFFNYRPSWNPSEWTEMPSDCHIVIDGMDGETIYYNDLNPYTANGYITTHTVLSDLTICLY